MFDFTRKLTLQSAISYVPWRMNKRTERPINLKLRSGARFQLRGNNFSNNDYGVAYEVFVHDYYGGGRLPVNNVRLIVDLVVIFKQIVPLGFYSPRQFGASR